MWLTPKSEESKKSVQKILLPTGLAEPRPDAEPEVKASSQSTGSNPARVPLPCQASGGDGGISRESGEKTEDSESSDADEEEAVERKS